MAFEYEYRTVEGMSATDRTLLLIMKAEATAIKNITRDAPDFWDPSIEQALALAHSMTEHAAALEDKVLRAMFLRQLDTYHPDLGKDQRPEKYNPEFHHGLVKLLEQRVARGPRAGDLREDIYGYRGSCRQSGANFIARSLRHQIDGALRGLSFEENPLPLTGMEWRDA